MGFRGNVAGRRRSLLRVNVLIGVDISLGRLPRGLPRRGKRDRLFPSVCPRYGAKRARLCRPELGLGDLVCGLKPPASFGAQPLATLMRSLVLLQMLLKVRVDGSVYRVPIVGALNAIDFLSPNAHAEKN
jgi:hypothetical protein